MIFVFQCEFMSNSIIGSAFATRTADVMMDSKLNLIVQQSVVVAFILMFYLFYFLFKKKKIGWQVRLAANSSVTKDITEPGDYGGFPAVRIKDIAFFFECYN